MSDERREPIQPAAAAGGPWEGFKSVWGLLSCRRSRLTLGFLLFLLLVAGPDGSVRRMGGAGAACAESVEPRRVTPTFGAAATALRIPGVVESRRGQQTPARSLPRWLDPTAGGRPPVRAPGHLGPPIAGPVGASA